jgi:hypothetical protein
VKPIIEMLSQFGFGTGGGAHIPPARAELVPQVPAAGSTQHAVAPGSPGNNGAGAVHIFEPQATGAAIAAPPIPTPEPPAPGPAVPPAPVSPLPPVDVGVLPAPAPPATPPVPPLVFSEPPPQPATAYAPSSPTETETETQPKRFILVTSLRS